MLAFSEHFKMLFLSNNSMSFAIKITVFVLFISSITINAQEQPRQQKIEDLRTLTAKIEQLQKQMEQVQAHQETIRNEVLSPSAEDKAEAERVGAEAFRLFPDKIIDDLTDDSDGASIYNFAQIAPLFVAPQIEYKRNSLEFTKNEKENFGLIVNLGEMPIENIDDQSLEVAALAQYQPPELKDAKSDYVSSKLTFGNKVVVAVGNTYLARVIRYGSGDAIFALKIHRRDSDESIILFLKQIKTFEPPQLKNDVSVMPVRQAKQSAAVDYETAQKVQNALLQKGFYSVTVDATTVPMTLRGTSPKGKLAEIIQLAQEANGGRPIRNELIEK